MRGVITVIKTGALRKGRRCPKADSEFPEGHTSLSA